MKEISWLHNPWREFRYITAPATDFSSDGKLLMKASIIPKVSSVLACISVMVILCNLAAFIIIFFPQDSVICLSWLEACRSQIKEDKSKAVYKFRPARICLFWIQHSFSAVTAVQLDKTTWKISWLAFLRTPKNTPLTHNTDLFHWSSKSYYPCDPVAAMNAKCVFISFGPQQYGRWIQSCWGFASVGTCSKIRP